jgi:hypothetical protein
MDPSAAPSPHRVSRGAVGSTAGWMALAISLALLSTAIDRTTTIEVYSDGGRIRLDVADTVLVAPRTIQRLTAIEILAMDSIDPPGGQRITLSDDRGEVLREQLPRRFRIPPGAVVPLGDWELDERAGLGTVWRRDVDVNGAFTLEASFRGRFLHDLTVVLHGDPTTSISIRRGLINDDMFIRDDRGFDLAATSIDPTPLEDAGAVGATLARSGAIACLLIACFTALQTCFRPHPLPASSSRFQTVPLVLSLAMAAVALSVWVARDVLEALPHTPDAVVYLVQADWILDGSLWSHVTPIQTYLTLPFTYVDGNRWLAHYPPAWPTVLAVGVAVGAPWLVPPMLGGAYVLLLFLAGRELDGPLLGLTAATLGVISPITRLLFASMLSHAFAATLVLAALVLALLARRRARWTTVAATGLALGVAFGVRPLTAVAVAVPMLLLALPSLRTPGGRARARNAVAGFLGGFVLAALPALGANQLLTGNPLSFPYTLAHGSMFGAANIPFGLRNLDALLASSGAANLGWGWDFLHGPWIIGLCFAPALVPLFAKRWRTTDLLLAAMITGVLIAYVGTRGHGLHGFGPRYYFEVLAPFFLLTARGFFDLARLGVGTRRTEKRGPVLISFGLFLALCLPAAAILPHRLSLYRGYNGVDGALERQLEALALQRALIVLPTDEWQGWAAAARLVDFRPDAPILFIQADARDPAIATIAGDRPIFLWRDGRLEPR